MTPLREMRLTCDSSLDKVRELQHYGLNRIVRHAFSHSEFYRRKYSGLGWETAENIGLGTLERLPILEKEELRSNLEKVLPEHLRAAAKTYRTGGTTGDFLKIYIPSGIQKSRSLAAAMRAWEWVGFLPGDPYVRLWGLPVDSQAKQRLQDQVIKALERRCELNAFSMGPEECRFYVEKLWSRKPRMILSHATPLMILVRHVQQYGVTLPPVKLILTTAEMLMPSERSSIEQVFGCRVYDYYGNRETNVIAAQCEKQDGYHVSAENGLIEVVDAQGKQVGEGEVGDILITDFHNDVMPLIRYRIGDFGVATYRPCSCGRALPMVKRFMGRKLEAIVTSGGRSVPGEFFLVLLDRYPWILKAQAVQEDLGLITLRIAFQDKPPDYEGQCSRMSAEIAKYLGDVQVRVVETDLSQFIHSGKHRWVISKVQAVKQTGDGNSPDPVGGN